MEGGRAVKQCSMIVAILFSMSTFIVFSLSSCIGQGVLSQTLESEKTQAARSCVPAWSQPLVIPPWLDSSSIPDEEIITPYLNRLYELGIMFESDGCYIVEGVTIILPSHFTTIPTKDFGIANEDDLIAFIYAYNLIRAVHAYLPRISEHSGPSPIRMTSIISGLKSAGLIDAYHELSIEEHEKSYFLIEAHGLSHQIAIMRELERFPFSARRCPPPDISPFDELRSMGFSVEISDSISGRTPKLITITHNGPFPLVNEENMLTYAHAMSTCLI
jgi:hypothetical protein